MKFKRLLQADSGSGTGGATAEPNVSTENPTNIDSTTEVVEPTKSTGETETTKPADNTVSVNEYEKLKAELEKLKGEVSQKSTLEETTKKLQSELDQLKKDKTLTDTKVTEYETVLEELVKSKLDNIPENYRELVPSNLPLKDTLNWLNKAESTGLFGQAKKEVPNVEIGKPMNPTSNKQHIDYSTMRPATMLAMAYGSNK